MLAKLASTDKTTQFASWEYQIAWWLGRGKQIMTYLYQWVTWLLIAYTNNNPPTKISISTMI